MNIGAKKLKIENKALYDVLERLKNDKSEIRKVLAGLMETVEKRQRFDTEINSLLGVEQGLDQAIKYIEGELGIIKIDEWDLHIDLDNIITSYDIIYKK